MSFSINKNNLNLRTVTTVLGLSLLMLASSANALNREQSRRVYDRIAGVPPTNAELDSMVAAANDRAAVDIAMANKNFLNVTVKNMVIPWTNKEQTVFAPLNDTVATIIGYVRDGDGNNGPIPDFRTILSADVIYIGVDNAISNGYSNSDNRHYEEIENENLDLSTVLQRRAQTAIINQPLEAVAGVMTTRQSARAFFYAGTNRAMFRFTMMNYLCKDLEQVKDITRTPNRVRKDVSRSPGGDSSIYLNNCIGCHAGMDGLAGAFAYHTWGPVPFDPDAEPDDQSMTYLQNPITYQLVGVDITTPSRVTRKHRHNVNNFKYGYDTTDNGWINYWRTGQNVNLGWDGTDNSYQPDTTVQSPSTGNGAASLGIELANTDAFARCQVTKVYRHICFNDPDQATLETLMDSFSSSGYNLREVFAESALQCPGS